MHNYIIIIIDNLTIIIDSAKESFSTANVKESFFWRRPRISLNGGMYFPVVSFVSKEEE